MLSQVNGVRLALRSLWLHPSFAIFSIIALSLSIASATAMFSVIDAVVVKPLPFYKPEDLVDIWGISPQLGYRQPASWPQLQDYRAQTSSFAVIGGCTMGSGNLQLNASAEAVPVISTTGNFFDLFQIHPLFGRTFYPDEDTPGRGSVVVLSYELWQSSFEANPSVLGTQVTLDGKPSTIIGVMPAQFRYPLGSQSAIYRPLNMSTVERNARGTHWLPLIARLKAGVNLEKAQADLQHVYDGNERLQNDPVKRRMVIRPLATAIIGRHANALRTLMWAVTGVLLIGCVNVTGLLLARGLRRMPEFALLSALGASRGNLLRKVLTESVILALCGCVGGVALAMLLLTLIRELLVKSFARGANITLNGRALLFSFLIALLCTMIAGLYPAVSLSRIPPILSLKTSGSAGTSRKQQRVRGALLIGQIALALFFLAFSVLLVRNLKGLEETSLGFNPKKILTVDLYLNRSDYEHDDVAAKFYGPLLDKVRNIPGVVGAGVIDLMPIREWGSNASVHVTGEPQQSLSKEEIAENRILMPGTLEALGAHIVEGRGLSDTLDRADTQSVALVNEKFVHMFLRPSEDPIDRQIEWDGEKLTIVGVVSNVHQSLIEPVMPELDMSARQLGGPSSGPALAHLTLIVHTQGEPEAVIPAVRAAVEQTNRSVPFRTPLTMQHAIENVLIFQRLESWLFGVFAVLAISLCLIGIYGTMMHEVELQLREVGIRMALGASRVRIALSIFQRLVGLVATGLLVGWLLLLATTRGMASVIDLNPLQNAGVLIAVTATLGILGSAVSVWPAFRAAAADPSKTMRMN